MKIGKNTQDTISSIAMIVSTWLLLAGAGYLLRLLLLYFFVIFAFAVTIVMLLLYIILAMMMMPMDDGFWQWPLEMWSEMTPMTAWYIWLFIISTVLLIFLFSLIPHASYSVAGDSTKWEMSQMINDYYEHIGCKKHKSRDAKLIADIRKNQQPKFNEVWKQYGRGGKTKEEAEKALKDIIENELIQSGQPQEIVQRICERPDVNHLLDV